MRYRVVLEQVMTTWYVTVTTYEPDGLTIQKRTSQYSFPAHETRPDDLVTALDQLSLAIGISAG